MSGHHPWSKLTKRFTPEDLEIVEAGAAEIVADSDRRERRPDRPAGEEATQPDALAALDQLQASLRERGVDVEQWAQDVESGRQAAGRRVDSDASDARPPRAGDIIGQDSGI